MNVATNAMRGDAVKGQTIFNGDTLEFGKGATTSSDVRQLAPPLELDDDSVQSSRCIAARAPPILAVVARKFCNFVIANDLPSHVKLTVSVATFLFIMMPR